MNLTFAPCPPNLTKDIKFSEEQRATITNSLSAVATSIALFEDQEIRKVLAGRDPADFMIQDNQAGLPPVIELNGRITLVDKTILYQGKPVHRFKIYTQSATVPARPDNARFVTCVEEDPDLERELNDIANDPNL